MAHEFISVLFFYLFHYIMLLNWQNNKGASFGVIFRFQNPRHQLMCYMTTCRTDYTPKPSEIYPRNAALV